MKLKSDLRDNKKGLNLLLSGKWLRYLLCFYFGECHCHPSSCSGSKPQSHHYIFPLPHAPHPISWPILLMLWPQRVWHLTLLFLLRGFCHGLQIVLPFVAVSILHYSSLLPPCFSSYDLDDIISFLKSHEDPQAKIQTTTVQYTDQLGPWTPQCASPWRYREKWGVII